MDKTFATLGRNSGGNAMISLLDNGLSNDWTVRSTKPLGDLKLNADYAHRWNLWHGKLGMLAALNYTNSTALTAAWSTISMAPMTPTTTA